MSSVLIAATIESTPFDYSIQTKSKPKKVSKRGRKKLYHDPLMAQVLSDIWVATNLACAKRLKVHDSIVPATLQEIYPLKRD